MPIIRVDEEFPSYDAVEERIQLLQNVEKFKLWKRDSRTISAAVKRMPKRVFNPEVKYNELLYCCVYGGRETNNELRSMRQRCPYQIKFRCTHDGQRLRVVSITPDHNHGPIESPPESSVVVKEEDSTRDSEVSNQLTMTPAPSPQQSEIEIKKEISEEEQEQEEASSDVNIEDLVDSPLGDPLGLNVVPDCLLENQAFKFESHIPFKQPKLKVILDVDTGIDDSHAIMLALAHHNAEILAITCANGNVNVDLVVENTLRVLKACNREDIPVYRGAECSLLGNTSQFENFSGEAWNTPVDTSRVEQEHAANAIIRIINTYPGEVTVVALAPLTNLALAIRLDSTVGRKIKDLYVMGGNVEGRGRLVPCAEFNFYNDPEAAQVVLKEFINITILPYEVCRQFMLPWDFFDLWISAGTPSSEFLRRSVLESARPGRAAGREGYWSCDGYCMALVLDRTVVNSAEPVYAAVELSGQFTRGQMVVDWDGLLGKSCNALVVKSLHLGKLQSLFMLMVCPSPPTPVLSPQPSLPDQLSALAFPSQWGCTGEMLPQTCLLYDKYNNNGINAGDIIYGSNNCR